VLEFVLLKHCASTSDFQCNQPITIKNLLHAKFVPLHFQFAFGASDLVTVSDDSSFSVNN